MTNRNTYYIPRYQEDTIRNLMELFPAVLIEGAKGVGKSTVGRVIAKSTVFMQDPEEGARYLTLAKMRPSAVLEGEKPRLIDEWQMEPLLWDAVRFYSDRTGGDPGQFILTGSAVPRDNSTMHTGTGRFARVLIRPMSLSESGESSNEVSLKALFDHTGQVFGESKIKLEEVVRAIVRGGWPLAVRQKEKDVSLVYARRYVDEIAEQDASRVDGVEKNPGKLRLFMKALARATATPTGFSKLRADVAANNGSISDETMYAYHNALKRIFAVEDLPAWNMKLRSKTAIRTSDVRHFADPSIAAALLEAGVGNLMMDPETLGLLFESLVIRDLRIYAGVSDGLVSHYRDANGLEADAIIHLPDGRWAAIEAKLGVRWADEAAKNLLKLKKVAAKEPEFLMVAVPEGFAYTRDDGVIVAPIGCLCP